MLRLRSALAQLVRHRRITFTLSIVLAIVAFGPAQRLAFDQSIESLYSADDPHLADYLESKSLFGGDEFAIIAFRDDGLFDEGSARLSQESAQRIRRFAKELSDIPGVRPESTQNLADALQFPYARDRVRQLMQGILVGTDGRTTSIILRLRPERDSPVARGETIRRIRETAANFELPCFVVGEPVQVHDMFRYVEEDGRLLYAVSLVLLGMVICVLFFNIRWMLLPLLLVVSAILCTQAALVVSGMRLSMVSSILNSLVTIIGIATVTHFTVRYRKWRLTERPEEAFTITLQELAAPVCWTCATTAVGFLALLTSGITPVRSFGTMMALGTAMVLLLTMTTLPGGALFLSGLKSVRSALRQRWEDRVRVRISVVALPIVVLAFLTFRGDMANLGAKWELIHFLALSTFLPLIFMARWGPDPANTPGEPQLVESLRRITDVVSRRPKPLCWGLVVVTLVSLGGFRRLRLETDFSKNFRESSLIVESLKFAEENLGGVGTWEVSFDAPSELTEEFLDRVRRLASSLRAKFVQVDEADGPHLTKLVALTDGLDLIPKLPVISTTLKQRLGLLRRLQPEFEDGLYNTEAGRMRFVLRAHERQTSARKLALIAGVRKTVAEEFSHTKTSGLFVLLTFLIESLLRDQLISFILAGTGIGAMMAIAFRSIRIGLISLVPNLFPIILVVGSMGWIGLPVNIATAMIASVSMGLTVDSSIHYLSAYRESRNRGATIAEALRETHETVGRALVFANFALIVGFTVLTLSHFIPLIYFGLLVSVAMLGGLIGNLVMLPLLLQWQERVSPLQSER